MIHALIDTVEHRKIVGFETGNRAQFDIRHGSDPRWIFLDSYRVKFRATLSHFLSFPQMYGINGFGDIYLSDEPPIIENPDTEIPEAPLGYQPLIGRDGRYLKGGDGLFIYGRDPDYVDPPVGTMYLIDPDNVFLQDPDGSYITESIA